jgi:ectoine hydroxylase-related dioxygenase (phytanoyl-CoA dioxygenase family)
MDEIKEEIEKRGFALVRGCVSGATLDSLTRAVDADQHGARNLLANAVVRYFAASNEVRRHVASVLGTRCFAVRGIFFNKNSKANWKVSWHQDSVISVRERVEIEGWGPWSCKAGVTHVRPSVSVVQGMLSIRLHLDECGEDNGPLRVLPGTHTSGFLSDEQIQNWPKEGALTCSVHRGDAILMKPLLLHASSPATRPFNRRVVHLEFAARDLPHGATWHDQVR